MPYDQYETVIGLEVHVQLDTASKAFCGDATAFGAPANTHISPVSLGHPGTLPRLNKKQVEYAIKLGLALGSKINMVNAFDRKNYFYADLPKGYQITQDRKPICIGGQLKITTEAGEKAIRIHHIHMEEDAGKSIHETDGPYSQIDLNRAGVPLLEIVSEPDLRSAEEVDAYMTAMRQLVRYLGVSDGNMEQGSLRCDVNVSVRPKGQQAFGERCEIKNLNSMRYARRAIQYEVKRQIDLIESGGEVRQETLNFDPDTGRTSPLRDKENAHDYRYFPEPDLPPIIVDADDLRRYHQELPALPWQLRERLSEKYGLPAYDVNLLTEEQQPALFFLELAQHTDLYKAAANLMINKVLPYCNEAGIELSAFPLGVDQLARLLALIEEGKVSNTAAYQQLFPAMLESPETAPLELAQSLNLLQNSDANALEGIIDQVIAGNPDEAARYRKGKKALIGFFMGEVMKASRGKADPKMTNQLLREKLSK
ncbi:Asp-tRNA(Asn)/Glu-tRNA(Gln) amidotransferase subunit GatB [Phaeodactylibacter xiamenensis]|uniref:Asp-tRNA(Asn)/Glu-tRNA(Gln) amidotransferase subunit GatB n=1 Tax=Phaeodactylibacter xiamenensis TaxID=1524460 RepID=UPI003BAC77FB